MSLVDFFRKILAQKPEKTFLTQFNFFVATQLGVIKIEKNEKDFRQNKNQGLMNLISVSLEDNSQIMKTPGIW